jgi:hypothetical protein
MIGNWRIEVSVQVEHKEPLNVEVREPLFMNVGEYKGKVRVDIRHYFVNAQGELQPGRSGINMPLDQFPTFLEGIVGVYNLVTGSSLKVVDNV